MSLGISTQKVSSTASTSNSAFFRAAIEEAPNDAPSPPYYFNVTTFSSVVMLAYAPRLNKMNMSDVSDVLFEDQGSLGEMIEEAFSAQVFEGSAVEFAEGHGPIQEFEDCTWNHGITARCQLHAHSRGRAGLGLFLRPSWKHFTSAVLAPLFTQGGRFRAGAPADKIGQTIS